MTTSTSTLWDDVLAQVRLNHPALSRGWFADLELAEVSGGVMSIRSANGAQLRYLEQHCRPAFTEAAQASTGRLIGVVFCTKEEPVSQGQEEYGLALNGDGAALNPDYTFDNFVTGPCNRLAHAAALAVGEDPGRAYNPFFAYGPVGLGKTHLLHAICHAIRQRDPGARCHYLSCETFINHFIEGVEQGALHQFRYRYRHVDVLIIDDIQFLAARERSQEEFFHTFNTLYQSQRQIILSADCSPAEIPSLEERLISRFNSGLVALLDRPCFETRAAIVRKKAKLRCIEVPEDVIDFVASRIDANIRELEGALIKLDAMSQTIGSPITMEMALEAFGGRVDKPVKIPTIIELAAKRYELKVSELLGKRRSKSVAHPRQICMYLARQLTNQSLEEIGGYFGGRDHTTVLHAHRTIRQGIENDPALAQSLDEFAREVKNAC